MFHMSQYRLTALLFITIATNTINAQTPSPYPAATPINYVRSWAILAPVTDINSIPSLQLKEARQTTQYLDGLGRPLQTVLKGGSLMTTLDNSGVAIDLVNPVAFDEFGREAVKYMPFVANETNGNTSISDGEFKLNPFEQQDYFYSDANPVSPILGQGDTKYNGKTDFEPSPLNRAIKTYAPGESWVGNNVGNSVQYWVNTDEDNVKIWHVTNYNAYGIQSYYKGGLLYKTISTDEQGHKIVEFKDKEGKIILKKVQLTDMVPTDGSGYDEWLCTYYVYDEFNQLRLVVPPKAVKILEDGTWNNNLLTSDFTNMLCFKYEYDSRNRMTLKKVPGAAPVFMVYDKWDRLVATQDGNLNAQHQWLYTKYDFLDRPIYTGLLESMADVKSLQDQLDISPLDRYESFQAGAAFKYTINNSFPELTQAVQILTVTFYDNYSFAQGLNDAFQLKNNEFEETFYTTLNDAPLYAQPLTQSSLTKGMVTGKIVYTLGTVPTALTTSIFYDDKGRVIQTASENLSGGIDFNTTQYNFAGQPLKNVLVQHLNQMGSEYITNIVSTTMEYDDLNRLLQIKKKIQQKVSNHLYESSEKVIVRNSYNALGQLQKKELGLDKIKETGTAIETLNYDYNIRGWLTGINKNYISDPSNYPAYFGMELAYDKNIAADATAPLYTEPQLSGNIAGTMWRTKGDEVSRKYDFKYDNLNRLLEANFVQKNADASWNKNTVDFSVIMGDGLNSEQHYDPTAYDENGNILRMQQWGLKINSSSKIDDLKYTYKDNGQNNQLLNVVDMSNDIHTTLGDFRTSDKHQNWIDKHSLQASVGTNAQYQAITDYTYDVNGNLTQDQNKDILSITYNILNLPQTITLKSGKGTINYLYDATGNKLSKTTVDNTTVNRAITTTSKYIAGFVYESKDIVVTGGNVPVEPEPGYTDKLQFLGHEEGRIRYNGVTEDQAKDGLQATFAFDYFVKDHLGNVRMVLTDEGKEDKYPAATLEQGNIGTEKTFYNIPDDAGTRVNKSSVPGYPNDYTTDPNNFIQKLRGNATKVGSSIVLKVMAGDKFNVRVSSWYKTAAGTTPGQPLNPLNDLLTTLTGGVVAASAGGSHSVTQDQLNENNPLSPSLASFLNDPAQINPDQSRPKAYLNWILFDEQFQYVSSSSGAQQVPSESTFDNNTGLAHVHNHILNGLPITKNGYLYVYVSNETPNIDVFFDNLQVTHYRGVIFEETHYYPFGLTMAGISSQAAGITPNKKKFNAGSELQSKEFTDGSGLELYATQFRSLDPQLGRWWQIDPKPDYSQSLYSSMNNNPISFNDQYGDSINDPGDQRKVASIERNINGRITRNSQSITNSQNKISTNNQTIDALKKKLESGSLSKKDAEKTRDEIKNLQNSNIESNSSISEMQAQNAQLNQSLNDIANLRSDQNFNYTFGSPNEGSGEHQVLRGEGNNVIIQGSDDGLYVHEMRHIGQSLANGGLRFSVNPLTFGRLRNAGSPDHARSNQFEVDAYQAQFSLDRNSYPARGGARVLSDINTRSLLTINGDNGESIY